ncbi:GatB/YqeY domain-containing protein [Candidatus Gottesmanbacteria bacterium]|nr:GatB/YqeY domain-containing protein [Candidatus Gottesmanbacteria bacterium]
MALVTELQSDMTAALKAGDQTRLMSLRMLLAAVKNAAIAKYGSDSETKLTDSDVIEVIKKQAKTHRESIDAFSKGGRQDLVDKEKKELTILEEYLPKELTDDELKNLLQPVVASGETNFGLLMKQAMEVVKDQVEGGRVAGVLKQMLKQ